MPSLKTKGVELKTSVNKPDTTKALLKKEWAEVEKFYEELIQQIVIPGHPTPQDLQWCEAAIDLVYTQARMDHARAKINYDLFERKHRLALKQAYILVKDGITDDKGNVLLEKPKTDKEKDAYAVQFVKTKLLDGQPKPLTEILELWEARFLFMEAVIDILREKRGSLKNETGTMKVDAQMGGGNQGS